MVFFRVLSKKKYIFPELSGFLKSRIQYILQWDNFREIWAISRESGESIFASQENLFPILTGKIKPASEIRHLTPYIDHGF